MHIIFHIGMGKTGTTSIQYALKNSAASLTHQKSAYLGMWFGAVDPAFTGLDGFARFLSQNDREKAVSADIFYRHLKARHAEEAVETFLFSNESLFAAGVQLEPFLRELQSRDLSMSFVAYLRDPRAWLPSAYTQWAIRHKTNEGPVQDFQTAGRRLIGAYEGIRFWLENFDAELTVRTFDSKTDIVQDFAEVTGLDLPSSDVRQLERSEPAETLLRAMYNTRFPEKMLPDRYDRVIADNSTVPPRSLRDMAERCFRHQGTEEIIAERKALFEYLRDRLGIDFLSGEPRLSKVPDEAELQRRVIDHLVEVTFVQAQRIERLERLVEDLAARCGGE